MTSPDDPEARIRDLERSLNEQSSELTHSSSEIGFDAAPPTRVDSQAFQHLPPPGHGGQGFYGGQPPYGQPFPPPPPPPVRASRTNWVLWGVVAGAVGAITVGAVTFFSTVLSGVGSPSDGFGSSPTVTIPNGSGGGGPFDDPTSRSGGNRPPAPVIARPPRRRRFRAASSPSRGSARTRPLYAPTATSRSAASATPS